ncbi:MAG: hypothetical protein JXB23_18495 [Candidatus Aminicenantes bacterium]|nr:hypothetical protein [Candidatus Aminicenantes bacterium]
MAGVVQWLKIFENVSCFYRHMVMLPLWNKYPDYQSNNIHALAIFLEGYAFERQGRRPDYFHAAVDTLFKCAENNELKADEIWFYFSQLLKRKGLNIKNNPLYPSSNPDNLQNFGRVLSVIEAIPDFAYSIRTEIGNNSNLNECFSKLISIRGIKEKIASFYLRDLAVMLKLNLTNNSNRHLLQPIDIWVKRTVEFLSGKKDLDKGQVAEWIIQNAIQDDLNPEHINMGIWFYGAYIANSEYRLNKTLRKIDEAQNLIDEFYQRIKNVIQNCKIK